MAFGSDGYDVTWPSGAVAVVDPIGAWGLQVTLGLLKAGSFHPTGLLADNLVARDGTPTPNRDQLYGTFGDSWRVTQAESLFDYEPGRTTESYTGPHVPGSPAHRR